MASTKRPQNTCKGCGYTWFPRGKSLSLKCPSCGSQDVKAAGGWGGAGILVVAAMMIFGGDKKEEKAAAPEVEAAAQVAADAAAAIADPATPLVAETARDEAISASASQDAPQAADPVAASDGSTCVNDGSDDPTAPCKKAKPSDQF